MGKKKKTAAAVLTIAAAFPLMALAQGAAGPSTDVWIDVIKEPNQDRICVTVPLAYGFVVVGSSDPDNTTPISEENGNILLPNVTVEKDAEGSYFLTYNPRFPIQNYSTTVSAGDDGEEAVRTGLAVNLGAYMEAADTETIQPPGAGEPWTMIPGTPSDAVEGVKKYRMGLEEHKFSQTESGEPAGAGAESYWLDGSIFLPAPADVETDGWTAAGTANQPSVTWVPVHVEVGGTEKDYTQTEESVKVGTIRWTVEAAEKSAKAAQED